jgi:hypothetical protein
MREERLDQPHPIPTDIAADNALEQRLIRALEMAPEPLIPSGFAARIASQLPAPRPLSVTSTRYGQNALRISMVALPIVLVAVASHAANNTTVGVALQWTLCAQFAGLAIWLGTQRTGLR